MDNVAGNISRKTEENINTPTKELKCKVWKREFYEENDPDEHVCTSSKQKKIVSDMRQKTPTVDETASLNSPQHDRKSKYVCEICNKTLSRKLTLINHYRSKHTGERPFLCDICGKCFISSTFLKGHYKYHTAEKLFKCDLCPRAFLLKQSLDVHSMTHTGKKKFKCEFCEKSFINKSSLQYHCSSHVMEKPFFCKSRNKTVRQESSLSNHYVAHAKQISTSACDKNMEQVGFVENSKRNLFDFLPKTVFRCLICKKCFGRKKLLERHFQYHTSKKSFVCHICKKSFKSKQAFVGHYRFHTREKPYKCNLCDKEFYDTRDLKEHIILNHDAGKQV